MSAGLSGARVRSMLSGPLLGHPFPRMHPSPLRILAVLLFAGSLASAHAASSGPTPILRPHVLSLMPGVRLGPGHPGGFLLTQAFKKYRIYPSGLVIMGRGDLINLHYLDAYRFPGIGGRGGLGWAFLNTTTNEGGKPTGVSGHLVAALGGGTLIGRNGLSDAALSGLEGLGYREDVYMQAGLQLDFHFYLRGHGLALGADVDYDFFGQFFLCRFSLGYLF